MKSLFAFTMVLLLSQLSLADSQAEMEKARALKAKLSSALFLMKGVNGIGIGGCDPQTGGRSDFRGEFVSCLSLTTVTVEAAQALEVLFPRGEKIQGVFVVVEAIGEISLQPGIKVSN